MQRGFIENWGIQMMEEGGGSEFRKNTILMSAPLNLETWWLLTQFGTVNFKEEKIAIVLTPLHFLQMQKIWVRMTGSEWILYLQS